MRNIVRNTMCLDLFLMVLCFMSIICSLLFVFITVLYYRCTARWRWTRHDYVMSVWLRCMREHTMREHVLWEKRYYVMAVWLCGITGVRRGGDEQHNVSGPLSHGGVCARLGVGVLRGTCACANETYYIQMRPTIGVLRGTCACANETYYIQMRSIVAVHKHKRISEKSADSGCT